MSSRPCLPLCRRRYKWQGPFAQRPLRRVIATADPSATLSPSTAFPVCPVIRSTWLRRFLAGTRRASPVAQHTLVTMPSLPPRRRNSTHQSVCAKSCSLRSKPKSSTSGAAITRLNHVRFRYSLVTRNHPLDGFVGRLQSLGFPPPCYPSYGAPTSTPVGPHWVCRPSLDAQACPTFNARCGPRVRRVTQAPFASKTSVASLPP